MARKDRNLPFQSPFNKLGLLNVSLPAEISTSARQIDYLLGYEYGNLITIAKSVDAQTFASVRVWLEKARNTYEECLGLLAEILDSETKKFPAAYESDIAKAQNYLRSLLDIKENLITFLLKSNIVDKNKAKIEIIPNLPIEAKLALKSATLDLSSAQEIKAENQNSKAISATNLDPIVPTLDMSNANASSNLMPIEVTLQKPKTGNTEMCDYVTKIVQEIISPIYKNKLKTFLSFSEVKVDHYSPRNELLASTTVKGICLQGLNTEDLKVMTLVEAKEVEIYDVLKQRINDLLTARPNFSQAELEVILFNKLEKTFSQEGWWKEAKMTKVHVGSIETTNAAETLSIIDVYPAKGEADMTIQPISSVTVPTIQLFADVKTTEVLDNFQNPLPSHNNETFTQRGDLAIEETDTEPRLVPIRFNTLRLPVVDEVEATAPKLEIVPTNKIDYRPLTKIDPALLPPDPTHYEATGNFTNSPDFIQYVISEYGSIKKFNQLLLKTAIEIENRTYDGFNRWLKEYKSPYETALSKLSVADFYDAFGGPELGSLEIELDTTGLPKLYNISAIREYATINNFKYETLHHWLIKLEDFKSEFPYQATTTLEDFLARSIIKKDLLAFKG